MWSERQASVCERMSSRGIEEKAPHCGALCFWGGTSAEVDADESCCGWSPGLLIELHR